MHRIALFCLLAGLFSGNLDAQQYQGASYSEYILEGKAKTIEGAPKRYSNQTDSEGRIVSWIYWDEKGNVTEFGESFYNVKGLVSEQRIGTTLGTDTILFQYDYRTDGKLAKMLEGHKMDQFFYMHRYSYTDGIRTDSVFRGDTLLARIEESRISDGLMLKIRDFEKNETYTWTLDSNGNPVQETHSSEAKTFKTTQVFGKGNRLEERASDTELVRYKYDSLGRLEETRFLDENAQIIRKWVRVYEAK